MPRADEANRVYFITDGRRTKVGVSSRVEGRLWTLQQKHKPLKLTLVYEAEAGYDEETILHDVLAEYATQVNGEGEWFDLVLTRDECEVLIEEGDLPAQDSGVLLAARVPTPLCDELKFIAKMHELSVSELVRRGMVAFLLNTELLTFCARDQDEVFGKRNETPMSAASLVHAAGLLTNPGVASVVSSS